MDPKVDPIQWVKELNNEDIKYNADKPLRNFVAEAEEKISSDSSSSDEKPLAFQVCGRVQAGQDEYQSAAQNDPTIDLVDQDLSHSCLNLNVKDKHVKIE